MYPRILTVQDISCVGQCSMTVALPILSACGAETCILPSAVLSTHTGGFSGFTFRDLSEDVEGILAHWEKENIRFDCIYTGYLGNCEDVKNVLLIAEKLLVPGGKLIVDPAMADHGKLYYGFDEVYVEAMRRLAEKADILLPNATEAAFLLGIPYEEADREEERKALAKCLAERFGADVVLTGIGFAAEKTGALVLEKGEFFHYTHRRVDQNFHGTGDVYSSAFTGALMQGKTIRESAAIAADFTLFCIENTVPDPDHWYGVKFETALPALIRVLFPEETKNA